TSANADATCGAHASWATEVKELCSWSGMLSYVTAPHSTGNYTVSGVCQDRSYVRCTYTFNGCSWSLESTMSGCIDGRTNCPDPPAFDPPRPSFTSGWIKLEPLSQVCA